MKLSNKQKWQRINEYIIASQRIQDRLPRVRFMPQLRLVRALGDVLYEEAMRLEEEVRSE